MIISSKSTIARRGFIFNTFGVWLVVSAIYYIDTLLSGSFVVDYDEGVYHKITKYVVCFTFSVYLLGRAKNYIVLFATFYILAVSGLLIIQFGLEISPLVMLTLASMGGFISVLHVWRERAELVARIVVYSGVIVGLFSMIELTVLSELFQSYWASTDGVRSVSTMFNPNNLGLYMGVCLIFVPFMKIRVYKKILCSLPIMFAFIASGSRTAWISLVTIILLVAVLDKTVLNRVIKYLKRYVFLFCVVFVAAVIGFLISWTQTELGQHEGNYRGASLYTANIRLENFYSYLNTLDLSIFLPDVLGVRSHLIQDNVYLIAMSSFGIIPLVFLALFFLSQFNIAINENMEIRVWCWVFVYYMISGLSGSFLNSFPNNQLFFISVGAIFVGRRKNAATSKQIANQCCAI